MKKKIWAGLATGLLMLGLSNVVSAGTIEVTYTATGSSGNYLLDFTVANNIPASYNQAVYFFGVDAGAVTASPSGWDIWGGGGVWNNYPWGGSSNNHISNWITDPSGAERVFSGAPRSNFLISTPTIPSDIHYFVFAFGGSGYYAGDAFYQGNNPGFEGTAMDSHATPEPATMLLLGSGLAGLLGARRQKRAQA